MPRPTRRRPSAALVVALVALFASLAGTAVAATAIKSNAQVGDNTINSRNVMADSLTGADVAESTLGAVPFAKAAASAPLRGHEIVQSTAVADPAHSVRQGSAICPAGKKILGGGAFPLGLRAEDQIVLEGHPRGDAEWQVDVQNVSDIDADFVVFATCAFVG